MIKYAYSGARIFDGTDLWRDRVLLREGNVCLGLTDNAPAGFTEVALNGGIVAPGFVDLQANGGGGVMLNDAPTVDTVRTMAQAHWNTGTRGFFPTLITDTPKKTALAIDAVAQAIQDAVPGVIGLHLEGPHLSVAKKGAHSAELIRPMTPTDEAVLLEAASRIPNLLATVAPESVTPEQIARLSAVGIVVSLGHSDCSFEIACACFQAGAQATTHLFNAMSQMQPRAPGLVGAALHSGVAAGVIADGIHVHPANIAAALRASDGLFLVTDAMATLGSEIDGFNLNGRRVSRAEGRLTLEDGTLAGADLTIAQAIRVMVDKVGVGLEVALGMATSRPAGLLREQGGLGTFQPGVTWTGVYLSDGFEVRVVEGMVR